MDSTPFGYTFYPTDEEVINHYLFKKITGQPLPSGHEVIDCDLYATNPAQIFDVLSNQNVVYIFTRLKKKHRSGLRVDRTDGMGTWKGQDKGKPIYDAYGRLVGCKRSFKYQTSNRHRSNLNERQWIMKEYCLDGLARQHAMVQDYVLCRIKAKNLATVAKEANSQHQEDFFALSSVSFASTNNLQQPQFTHPAVASEAVYPTFTLWQQGSSIDPFASVAVDSTYHLQQQESSGALASAAIDSTYYLQQQGSIDPFVSAAVDSTYHFKQQESSNTLVSAAMGSTNHLQQHESSNAVPSAAMDLTHHLQQHESSDALASEAVDFTYYFRQQQSSDALVSGAMDSTNHLQQHESSDALALATIDSARTKCASKSQLDMECENQDDALLWDTLDWGDIDLGKVLASIDDEGSLPVLLGDDFWNF